MNEDTAKKAKLDKDQRYFELPINKVLEDCRKSLEIFNKSFSPAIKEINDMAKRQTDALRPVIEQMNIVQAQLNVAVRSFQPQINLWKEWAKANEKTFKVFRDLTISRKRNDFLLDNGWILCPYLANKGIEKILRSDEILNKNNSEINAIYESFFCENKYAELEKMVEGWRNNKFFKKRMPILIDCLFLIKSFRKDRKNLNINPSRLIIPELIAQIDGITTEFAKDKGLKIDKMKWRDSAGNKVDKFDCIWEKPCYDNSEISTITMLESYLFSQAYPYGQINPTINIEQPKKVKLRPFFQFSRHKIMHGEDLRFGTIDNVLRLFILLDFLANLN